MGLFGLNVILQLHNWRHSLGMLDKPAEAAIGTQATAAAAAVGLFGLHVILQLHAG
jgi:hypothetical protein